MSHSDSDDDDDLFAGAPIFKRESRAAKAKQTRTFNYLDKMLKHTVENSEKRQKIESLMKESKDGPGDQSDVIFSLKKEEPDENGTKECYDDNDDRYWEKVESMAQIANETAHKRDQRRRDLEDLIDGYNVNSQDGFTLEDELYSPMKAREKRQDRIHAEQVGTSSNVGSRRIFGYSASVSSDTFAPTFPLFQSLDEETSALNEILRFDSSSILDQDMKSKFEIFQEKVLYPFNRTLQMGVLEDGIRLKRKEWSVGIPYASEFMEWLIRAGLSCLDQTSTSSSCIFDLAQTLLRNNVDIFRLNVVGKYDAVGKYDWHNDKLSLSELSQILYNDYGMYSSKHTPTENNEAPQNSSESFRKTLSLSRTLQLWDTFIEKGYVQNQDFIISSNGATSDQNEGWAIEHIIRDLIVSLLDPHCYNDSLNERLQNATINLICTIFKRIALRNEEIHAHNHFLWKSYSSESGYDRRTEWLKTLSKMVIEKISTLPNPWLPLALAYKNVPYKENDDDLLFIFSVYLAYESLTHCLGDTLQVPLANKIQSKCLAIVKDTNENLTLDDACLRFEAIAMTEVALSELLKSDGLRSDPPKFLCILEIASDCERSVHKLLQKNDAKTSAGGLYQSTAEATAMFHYYGRLIDLCTTLRKSVNSVISDSNLRRIKELLSFLLTDYGVRKNQACILAKISDNSKRRQSSLMSFIQKSPQEEGINSEEDEGNDSDES